MDEQLKRGLHAELAKAMAMFCVRNTELENIHAGLVPVTRTGDYSDVIVIDAEGRCIVSAVPKMHVDGRYEDAVPFQASSSASL